MFINSQSSLGNSAEDRKFYWKNKEEAEHFRTRKFVVAEEPDELSEEDPSMRPNQKCDIPFT